MPNDEATPRRTGGIGAPTERSHGDDIHATGDALSAEILASVGALRFAEAEHAADREACLHLRYRAVLERRMAGAADFPEGLERDDFDERAIHILGRDGDRPIATSRILLPVADRPLPTERAFGLQLPAAGRVVEWGRVVVDPEYRGDGHSIFMGLAAQGWRSMRARGYTDVIAATSRRLIALFEVLGFTVTVLGDSRTYWGEERVPILCEGSRAIEGLARASRGDAGDSQPESPPSAAAADQ